MRYKWPSFPNAACRGNAQTAARPPRELDIARRVPSRSLGGGKGSNWEGNACMLVVVPRAQPFPATLLESADELK